MSAYHNTCLNRSLIWVDTNIVYKLGVYIVLKCWVPAVGMALQCVSSIIIWIIEYSNYKKEGWLRSPLATLHLVIFHQNNLLYIDAIICCQQGCERVNLANSAWVFDYEGLVMGLQTYIWTFIPHNRILPSTLTIYRQ